MPSMQVGNSYEKLKARIQNPEQTLKRLSTKVLLRNVILGQIFKTPLIFKPGLHLLDLVANSHNRFLNADANPFIRSLVLPSVYRQFCAGRNVAEVKRTISSIKSMGYSGVILCYAGEVVAQKNATRNGDEDLQASEEDETKKKIEAWKQSNLMTLDVVNEGDLIGIKYATAGSSISQALRFGQPPPPAMLDALHEICSQAVAQNKQIWFDAEEQMYHPAIDMWTTDLMRKYNRNGRAFIFTTIQAYLKSSRNTTERYLRQAQQEGWTLGIKLVRGAYIAKDVRSRIHDTKADTDASYDSIAHDINSRSWPGINRATFPEVELFLAGHNTESIRKASTLVQRLAQKGEITRRVSYGQLQGMADDVGCELLALSDQVERGEVVSPEQAERNLLGSPRVMKCLSWGSVHECLHYLVRRAVENRGAAERMSTGLAEMKRELRRRILGF